MKNCEYYEELISRSLDDALSVEERKELAVHLASCPSCSQMWQLMADISGMMEEDMEELPADLHENIMAGVRRSEMIEANRDAGSSGKHFVPRKITITKPVRKLLATAACMVLVIAAAVGANPAGRAENVIAARSTQDTAEVQGDQRAAADVVIPEATAAAETAVPTMTLPAPTDEPASEGSGSDVIVTTPTPAQNVYLSTPTPVPTQAPAQVIPGTPIGKAAATPEPATVPTTEPEPEEVSAPTGEAQTADAVAAKAETEAEKIEAPVQLYDDDAALSAQHELPVEIQKSPPVRVFSLIPSLAALLPEQSPVEESDEAPLPTDLPAEAAVPTPEPTDSPQPQKLDLIDSEEAGSLVLLLAGTLDEDGLPPEEAALPEDSWDESYVVEMVFDEIPCELTVRIYDEKVYFALVEILIDSTTVDGAAQPPTSTPSVTPEPAENMEPVAGHGAPEDMPEEDFELQWLLAKCSCADFIALLEEVMK